MADVSEPNQRTYPTIKGVPVMPFKRRSIADVRNSRKLRLTRENLAIVSDARGRSVADGNPSESSGTVAENLYPAADLSGANAKDMKGGSPLNKNLGESRGTVVENLFPAADLSGTKAPLKRRLMELSGGSVLKRLRMDLS